MHVTYNESKVAYMYKVQRGTFLMVCTVLDKFMGREEYWGVLRKFILWIGLSVWAVLIWGNVAKGLQRVYRWMVCMEELQGVSYLAMVFSTSATFGYMYKWLSSHLLWEGSWIRAADAQAYQIMTFFTVDLAVCHLSAAIHLFFFQVRVLNLWLCKLR